MATAVLNKKEKKKVSVRAKTIWTITAVFLALIIGLSIMLGVVINKKGIKVFEPKALSLPIEEQYALKQYSYDDLSQTVTTVRNDLMYVSKRGIARQTPTELGHTYKIENDLITNYSEQAAIDFANVYPYPSSGVDKSKIKANPTLLAAARKMYPGDNDDDACAKYFYYYKYMLMSQGYNITLEAQKMSALTVNNTQKQQEFKAWLKKHPAADQYGEIVGTNNAVEKVIRVDPIYRSNHPTGLYMPAGEVVTVKVQGLKEGERMGITLGLQNSLAWRGSTSGFSVHIPSNNTGGDYFFADADYLTATGHFTEAGTTDGHPFIQSQWARQNYRLPWWTADFTFSKNGTYYIGTPFGGLMHITMGNCYSAATMTITGAVETPHYILGVTTPEYFDTYLRNAPGTAAVLETENGQLVCSDATAMRSVKTEEIDKLANLWHSFFAVNESFTGGAYNRHNIVKFDLHVPAGAAVALGNYTYACPTGWFYSAMNYRGLLASGSWGILHEIGHNHSSSYGVPWGFAGGYEGEVRNNALTVLAYILLCDTGTSVRNGTASVEHGFVCNGYSSLLGSSVSSSVTDYEGIGDYFKYLSMYTNIMHSFGAEKFYELLYSYKSVHSYIEEGTNGNKRSEFAFRCAKVYGMNFLNYFNNMYKANITNDMYSAQQLAYLKRLPKYEPVACFYAGGIDGVKTGGDYIVNYGKDVEFDLLKNTISSLDSNGKKGFEIVSVSCPIYGTLKDLGGGKYSYSFNDNYNGTYDEFAFKVKMKDGVVHQFLVSLRINYPVLSTYNGISAPSNANDIYNKIFPVVPTVTKATGSGIPSYTTKAGEYVGKKLEYYWQAPKTGRLTFHLNYKSGVQLWFGENFNSIRSKLTYSVPLEGWTDGANIYFDVEAGKKYAVRILNYNSGGEGFVRIGYKYQGDKEITEIPASQIVLHNSDEFNSFVFEPNFLVSKKNGIKVGNNSTTKNDWEIIKAPDEDYLINGRMDVVRRTRFDEDGNLVVDASGNPVYDEIKLDKWDYLIDGDVGTTFHTTYGSYNTKKVPYCDKEAYEFVIDTQKEQQFNYFTVTTRTGAIGVSKITKYKLMISLDGTNWSTISQGNNLAYKSNVATLNFNTVTGRYLKLVVNGSTGNDGQFVVIAELDAGISSSVQRLIPATSDTLYHTKGWQDSSNILSEQNGYLIANKKNQKLVLKFEGERFTIYGAVGQGYGKADLKIDGKKVQTLDFNSSVYESRKLMAYYDNLEKGEHTVEIITKSSEKVMINMFGFSYYANMLNAPNIYLEKALTISLVVFILLFLILLAFILCLLFIPRFRKFMGNNKAIRKLDEKLEQARQNRKIKKEEKKRLKAEQKSKEADAKTKETKAKVGVTDKKAGEVKDTKTKVEQKASVKPAQKTAVNNKKPEVKQGLIKARSETKTNKTEKKTVNNSKKVAKNNIKPTSNNKKPNKK